MSSLSTNLADVIGARYQTCVFLSPHLDDAVFSAGDLLLTLQARGLECVVATFFTQAHPNRPTLSARAFLSQSHNPSSVSLFQKRRQEDQQIFERLGVASIHYPFVDAMWRVDLHPSFFAKLLSFMLPEFTHLYPTYRFHIKRGFQHPKDLIFSKLGPTISSLHSQYPKALFLAPIGTGLHTDHLFVRDAAASSSLPLLYWNDYPYSLHSNAPHTFIQTHQLHPYSFLGSWKQKVDLVLQYQTQVSAIFPSGIPSTGEELYYLSPAMERLLSPTA